MLVVNNHGRMMINVTTMRMEALRSMYLKTLKRVHYLLKHYSSRQVIGPDIELLQRLSAEIMARETRNGIVNGCGIGSGVRGVLASNIKVITTYAYPDNIWLR